MGCFQHIDKKDHMDKLSEEKTQSTYEETVKIIQERSHEYEVMVAEQQEHSH